MSTTDGSGHQTDYQKLFDGHDRQRDNKRLSARVIADALWRYQQPTSVIDVGCGMGFFLAEVQERGAAIQGVDGTWITDHEPEVPLDAYALHDLEQPFSSDTRYDLAVSLEVGEHLSKDRSEPFVAELCALSDHVLFSAAIPGQWGNGHINNRWQGDWAQMFADQGYRCYDPFRRKLFGRGDVGPWFGTNLLYYVREGVPVPDILEEHRIEPIAASYLPAEKHARAVRSFRQRIRELKAELKEAQSGADASP